jgi:hypothetical protein
MSQADDPLALTLHAQVFGQQPGIGHGVSVKEQAITSSRRVHAAVAASTVATGVLPDGA